MLKLAVFSIIIGVALAAFPNGQFRYGIAFDGSISDDTYRKYDFISIWINTIDYGNGKRTDFNQYYQGDMIKKCLALGKTPFFYAYIIAFQARAEKDIQDCDVNPGYSLCTHGAQYIRDNRAKLVDRYRHQSAEIAKALGDKNKECVFLMEPDFWQFSTDGENKNHRQQGGPLTPAYLASLLKDFIAAIKSNLPNARISFDTSAWAKPDQYTKWWAEFKNLPIDFINTSGGQSHGESASIKPNELSWSFISKTTGKKIIADCGYGVAGAAASNCQVWNDKNRGDRIKDGVIALSCGIGAKNSPPASLTRQPL